VGAFDLAGNVREWVSDVRDNAQILKCGQFASELNVEFRASYQVLNISASVFDSYGFRCSRSYE
jgi:formylglycine-generating enzyme required for sulfatase activity